jgi:hypothetical protein
VWLPTKPGAGSGSQVRWNAFEEGQGFVSLAGFGGAIINTMQNWRDNLQTTAAGYRERIVHVSLRSDEGGLNLTMPPELLKKLSNRGVMAGQALRNNFDFCTHIWARYRLTMCSLHRYLDALDESWNQPVPQDGCGWKQINCTRPPHHYRPCNPEEQHRLQTALYQGLHDLLIISQGWTGQHFCEDSPRPEAILRGEPKF